MVGRFIIEKSPKISSCVGVRPVEEVKSCTSISCLINREPELVHIQPNKLFASESVAYDSRAVIPNYLLEVCSNLAGILAISNSISTKKSNPPPILP